MNKAVKIIGIAAAVLVVLVVALVILVRVFVTPERIKAVVVPMAQDALQREISLGEVEVGLFSGIVLNDLTIYERESPEAFVAADRVVLRFKLIPLLFRRVIVDEARFDRPLIHIERIAEDRFNFSDLLDDRVEQVVTVEPGEERDETPIDLLISQIAVQGGELVFTDHAHQGEEPLRFRLSAFDFSARSISLTSPFPWQASGDLNPGRMEASGRIDPRTAQGSAEISVRGLDIAQFTPYFQEALPGRLNAMTVQLDLRAEGGAEQVASRGEVRLDGIDLLVEREGDEPLHLRDAAVRIDYDLVADLAAQTLTLSESTLRFNQIPVRIAGTVADYADEPRVDLRLNVPEIEVREVLAALPPGLVPPLDELEPAGRISARAELRGPAADVENLVQNGEVRLNRLSARVGELRPALDGVLRLGPGTVRSENLQMQLGDDRAAIDLQVNNLFGDIIEVRSDISAERFALDPLLQTAAAPAVAAEERVAEPFEPLDLPLRAQGSVRVGQTVYKGLTVNDFLMTYRLENNVLTVQQLSGKSLGGSFEGNARLDLGNPQPPFRAAIELRGLQADPLVSAFLPAAAGSVFGTMNLQTQLEGRGIETDQIRRTLTGGGAVSIRDGRLTGDGLVRDLADFLNLEELRVLRFSEARGSFTARDGNLQVNSVIDGSAVRMNPTGTVGLENFALDLSLNPRFSPDLLGRLDARGTVTQFLKDDQGWGSVPIRVAGTASEPRFTIDTTGIQRQLRERADQELRQQLERGIERLLPRQEPPETPEGEAPAEEPRRSPIEDAIRGLFR